MFNLKHNQSGSMLIIVLVATGLFLIIMLGAIGLGLLQRKLNISKIARAQALHIAEAGVNYYRWVLYHDHEEYCNGEGACIGAPDYGPYGPYAYTDSGGENIIGYYELYITPPAQNGSTIVNIKSVGWVADHPNVKREIEVMCGIPSWATYATITNGADANLGYGTASEVWGPVHCNYGLVRMNGIANNIVTSSQPGSGTRFGVYTCRDVEPFMGSGVCDPSWDGNDPPLNMPDPERPNFKGGRDCGSHIPIVDFNLLNNEYMNSIYDKATTSGLVFDPQDDPYPIPPPPSSDEADINSESAFWDCESDGSCSEGFHIIFKSGNKFDIKKVSAVRNNVSGEPSRSIQTESAATEYDIPANGIIFVKSTVWVDGHLDNGAAGSRATILAFEDPIAGDGDADIIINDNLTYANYDGTDSIGLIAQRNVTMGAYVIPDDHRIDAALLAKTGRRFRESYGSLYKKNSCTIYGQTASYLKPYMSGGYDNRYYIYDNNLSFAPPPHYPTTGEYTFISWKEK